MPELPEVETSRRGIEPHIVDQIIQEVRVRQPRLRYPVSDEIIHLKNQRVLSVQRRAKYLLLELERGWIIIHLGMSGSVRILPLSHPVNKHDHIDVVLSNGPLLRYTDPRRFGAWLWVDDLAACKLLANLGPEPLSEDFNASYLQSCVGKRTVPVKTWIMDNHVVVGVGNIYACESLFKAKILPERPINTLTQDEIKRLVQVIKSVIAEAILQGGTTLKDFLQADGKPGYFVQQLQVYGRKGQNCPDCETAISVIKLGQRSTYFCSICQH